MAYDGAKQDTHREGDKIKITSIHVVLNEESNVYHLAASQHRQMKSNLVLAKGRLESIVTVSNSDVRRPV